MRTVSGSWSGSVGLRDAAAASGRRCRAPRAAGWRRSAAAGSAAAGRSRTGSAPSELKMNGSCRLLVARSTVSRTLRKNRLSSSPGIWKCASRAAANGLWSPCRPRRSGRPWWPCTTMVLRGTLSTRARPGLASPRGRRSSWNARQAVDERVVAAGVEQDDADLLGLRDLAEQEVERQRLVQQVALALQPRIGRQQVVLAVRPARRGRRSRSPPHRPAARLMPNSRTPRVRPRKSGS